MKKKVSLFLDSGAYSAFAQNTSININNYIAFIKEHQDYIDVYANLDVIGDAEKTLENQKKMEAAGLHPIPCYHHGEDIKYLHFYVNNYSYIALGGLVGGLGSSAMAEHLDKCFAIICDQSSCLPKVKVHGFGMTSLELMLRYPWWSCDSTSWVLTGRFGGIFVPKLRNGEYLYSENPFKINVSNRSPSSKEEGQHFFTMSKMEQEVILEYFQERGYIIGRSEYRKEDRKTYKLKSGERWANSADAAACRELIEELGVFVRPEDLAMRDLVEIVIEPGLCNDYKQRDELNLIYFLDLEDHMPKWPWPFKSKKSVARFGFK